MNNQPFRLSIHLVTYNGFNWLPYCLESLVRSSFQDFFLLIIDNASLDGSVNKIKQFLQQHQDLAARARLVQNKQNFGFARAHNQALAWSQSEYVMLLNQDLILTDNYLIRLLDCLDNNQAAGAAAGKLRQWQFDQNSFYYDSLKSEAGPWVIDSAGFKIYRTRQVVERHSGKLDDGKETAPLAVFGVSGAAPIYRRRALEEVSPQAEFFDEDFGSYKEDVDMAWRLQWAGYGALYVPAAVAYHDRSLQSKGQKSPRALKKYRQTWSFESKVASLVNHWAVLLKNDCWFNFWRDSIWLLGFEFKKLIYFLIFEPVVLFSGLIRFFKLWPKFWRKRRLLKTTHRVEAGVLRQWWQGN